MRLLLLWLPLFVSTHAEPNRCTSACVTLGECTPAQGGRCVAAIDDDCRSGRVCAENGRCTATKGVCFATVEADCLASTDCLDEARCTLNDSYCEARSDEDCRSSVGCQQRGACGIHDGECEPRDSAHGIGALCAGIGGNLPARTRQHYRTTSGTPTQ